PRIVKPQANVYTVLLLVACLFAGAALGLEIMRYKWIKAQESPEAKPGAPTVQVEPVSRVFLA
ncbi:MAG: hypothetical protein PHU85_04450, partial [Phycisphaerae bacterium]|nr:hypothetical protein [Phycisphaerae bacterium]